jgi:hypothetical protein
MNAPFHVRRVPMIRISLPYLYSLSETLESIARLDHSRPTTKGSLLMSILGCQHTLEGLLQGSVFSRTLRSSRPVAEELLRLIRDQYPTTPEALEEAVSQYQLWELREAYSKFKTVSSPNSVLFLRTSSPRRAATTPLLCWMILGGCFRPI